MTSYETFKTKNKMGYTSNVPDIFQQKFIDFSAQCEKPVLDIGAAFGVASILALKKGAQVIANDIDPRHLEILKENTPREYLGSLELKPGKIPEDINFKKHTLSAILAARSLIFLSNTDFLTTLSKMKDWLEPGGKVFFVGTTPFIKMLQDFIPIFESKKKAGNLFAGAMDNFSSYMPPSIENDVPSHVLLFDEDTLHKLFFEAGFEIEEISYFRPYGTVDEFLLDGRELIGLVARTPN